jgi:hypothetical protein
MQQLLNDFVTRSKHFIRSKIRRYNNNVYFHFSLFPAKYLSFSIKITAADEAARMQHE